MKPVQLQGFRTVNQNEDHTCGFCAMSAVYRYYGLSPSKLRLRARLGTDEQAVPATLPPVLRKKLGTAMEGMSMDSKGTLPMDMFAVLFEDGFDIRALTGGFESARPILREHLKRGHPALALSVADAFHWVVITGMDDEGVWVADSSGYLDPLGRSRHKYRITDECAGEKLNGFVLTKRGKRARERDMTGAGLARQHSEGLAFSTQCLAPQLKQKVTGFIRQLLQG